MILLLAPARDVAREWLRCSGADPANVVVVHDPSQLRPWGVFDDEPHDVEADEYDFDEFAEIVETGELALRWWRNGLGLINLDAALEETESA